MIGWVIAAFLYGLTVLFVYKASNDRLHRMMAPVWPLTLLYLLLTIRKSP